MAGGGQEANYGGQQGWGTTGVGEQTAGSSVLREAQVSESGEVVASWGIERTSPRQTLARRTEWKVCALGCQHCVGSSPVTMLTYPPVPTSVTILRQVKGVTGRVRG